MLGRGWERGWEGGRAEGDGGERGGGGEGGGGRRGGGGEMRRGDGEETYTEENYGGELRRRIMQRLHEESFTLCYSINRSVPGQYVVRINVGTKTAGTELMGITPLVVIPMPSSPNSLTTT